VTVRRKEQMTRAKFDDVMRSFEYSLRAAGKSQHTINQYLGSPRAFLEWYGRDPLQAKRHDIEGWLAELSKRLAPATVAHLYSGLKAFYRWLLEEDEIAEDPMAKVRKPKVPETEKDIVPAEVMARVLSELDSTRQYREAAIISLLYDTGMRANELVGLRVDDIDWDEQVILIRKTKNAEIRVVPFSNQTGLRLRRWLRKRPHQDAEHLFTAQRGPAAGRPLTTSGLRQIVQSVFEGKTRGSITPHDLRHTFATHFLEDETARPEDLMTIAGWKSDAMLRRYTRSRKQARAIAAHRRLSPVARLNQK